MVTERVLAKESWIRTRWEPLSIKQLNLMDSLSTRDAIAAVALQNIWGTDNAIMSLQTLATMGTAASTALITVETAG